jgi:hypothetical protein
LACLINSLALLTVAADDRDSTNRLHFPVSGFSVAPLEVPAGESTQQSLMMFLPATDGFAPNVNVQIQPYPGTIDDYVALTLKQLKSMEIKVLEQKKPTKSVAIFEYQGELQGRSLHWYARAEKSADHVYLITATATPSQWKQVADRLKPCVDSFRCNAIK